MYGAPRSSRIWDSLNPRLQVWAAWYKLKFCYYLGLPIAIASAVVLADTYSRVASKHSKAAIMAVIALLSTSMISTAVYHTATRIPMLLTSAEAQEMNLAPKPCLSG